MSVRNCAFCLSALCICVLIGCSRGPSRVHPPSINASSAGAEAVEIYDADKDGKIGGAELEKSPPLKYASSRIDLDGDGAITAYEITARIKVWQDSKIGRMPLSCTVMRNGRPLADAEVRFVPEEFLGKNIKTVTGVSNSNGSAMLKVETTDDSDPPGVPPGLYRIEITKTGENIPAKYNTETMLGQEVALDATGILGGVKCFLNY